MAKKKRNTEDRNFFRFMTAIGIVVIGGLGYAFLDAAPSLSRTKAHLNANIPGDCLKCHVEETKNSPIMPHRPMEACNACHQLKENPS